LHFGDAPARQMIPGGGHMGGSTPDWAGSEEDATLEEVFTSRTFGRPLPKGPRLARPAVTAGIAAAATRPGFLPRSPVAASIASAAAAFSVVAVLTVGSGP